MMGSWLVFTISFVFAIAPADAIASFVSGDDCQQFSSDGTKMSLACSLRTLAGTTLFSEISPAGVESVSRLTVTCNDVYFYESFLEAASLHGLSSLRSLSLEYCKMGSLKTSAMEKVRNLRNLTVRTWNSDWPMMSLTMEPHVFRPLRHLERLDLSTNNMWELPQGALCHLSNLKSLNLSFNRLHDLTKLGYGGGGGCTADVTSLDLSSNDVTILPSGVFSGLSRLSVLSLANNELGKIDDDALVGLEALRDLDLSHNRLVALPEDAFRPTPQLMFFRMKNNSMSVIAPELFRGLGQLMELDLSHNELSSSWLSETVFQGLIRLMRLDLSHNNISQLHQHVFQDLYSVQVLRLSHNSIETIPKGAFASCVNLHTLELAFNHLTVVSDGAFQGLNVLSFLALDNNKIKEITYKALTNLTNVQDINLNHNNLTEVPEALRELRLLRTLDLGDNKIRTLKNTSIHGLTHLYGLRLVNNEIGGNLTKASFVNLPSLKILNLAKNKISSLEWDLFERNPNLQAVRLDANMLTDINGVFANMQSLMWLNVSDNRINFFDYGFVPPSLQWLDLHMNDIDELGNNFERHDLNIQTLDVSFNRLEYINSIQIPDSVQLLFLNDNGISLVEPFTFFKKTNLSRVDLFANKLENMDASSLQLSPVPPHRPRPEFYLGGNPFVCDCTMEWLQRVNQLEHRHHPTIMDLESIYCKMPFARTAPFIPIIEVDPSQFLCKYETHCFALCQCCEYDACDCEMTCPEGCDCYHDQSWNTNVVECSSQNMTRVPDRIPMDATEVYIDGNMIKNLSSHTFIGRKHLRILYVNSSGVELLDNETFSGLTSLNILYMHDNYLEALHGHEFHRLEHLHELHLHNNRLRYIHQHTFASLTNLKILTLHNNNLVNFPVWRLVDNTFLLSVSLSNNDWTCHCQFVESFGIWLSANQPKVSDLMEVRCLANETNRQGPLIVDYNITSCLNMTTPSTIVQPVVIQDFLQPVIVACAICVVLVIMVVALLYRTTIRGWVYARCGKRLCYKTKLSEKQDRLFDAYVSYSSKDEAWVTQVLAAELEQGEKPYRVSLHYRDFPVSAYIADTIVEAIEASRRTIIVLSRNYIDNEWCRFQFKSAHHESLKNRCHDVVIIVLGDVYEGDLDEEMRFLLRGATCVFANDKHFWPKLRGGLPESSMYQRVEHIYHTIPEMNTLNKCNNAHTYEVPQVHRSAGNTNVYHSRAFWA
ncbi:toll-like receptor 6 [Oratosquilla oratoria]|uniref:toll-like receptor 6 n=1 Tax=Oratosquilla oratoria TaxID=337810 RepID=UPI003F759CDC